MPTSTYTYNLDGAMTTATGESFTSIRRHAYTRLPTVVVGSGGEGLALRYDSQGKRLHKTGAQTIFYRNGVHNADALVEHVKTDAETEEIIYLLTPAGQTVTRRSNGYVRVASDHLTSVRAETYLPLATCHLPFATTAAVVTAHYDAYGKAIITGGTLRYAFTGYEWDAETALYNARRRLYSPALRLFVSVDPRLQDASPYPYCASDPFNHTDPTGGSVAAIIGGIVQALIVIATIVLTCVTEGAGAGLFAPEAAAADATQTSLAMSTILAEDAASEASEAAASTASTIGGTVVKAAAIGFVGTAASNGANLITKAAQGEHITAWQAVKSIILEPLVAAAAAAVSGGILAGGSLVGGNMAKALSGVLSSLAYSAISSIGTAAVNNQLSSRADWEDIGIQMAMAVGEAALIEGAYLNKGIESLNNSLRRLNAKNAALRPRVMEKIDDLQAAHAMNDPNILLHADHKQARAVQKLVEAGRIKKDMAVAFAYPGEVMEGMDNALGTGRGIVSEGYIRRHPDKYAAFKSASAKFHTDGEAFRAEMERYAGMGGRFLGD
jgi:RHS repeat-associated protein